MYLLAPLSLLLVVAIPLGDSLELDGVCGTLKTGINTLGKGISTVCKANVKLPIGLETKKCRKCKRVFGKNICISVPCKIDIKYKTISVCGKDVSPNINGDFINKGGQTCDCFDQVGGYLKSGVKSAVDSGDLTKAGMDTALNAGSQAAVCFQKILGMKDNEASKRKALENGVKSNEIIAELPEIDHQLYYKMLSYIGVCGASSGSLCRGLIGELTDYMSETKDAVSGGLDAFQKRLVNALLRPIKVSDDFLERIDQVISNLKTVAQKCAMKSLNEEGITMENVEAAINFHSYLKEVMDREKWETVIKAIKTVPQVVKNLPTKTKDLFNPKTFKNLVKLPDQIKDIIGGSEVLSDLRKGGQEMVEIIPKLKNWLNADLGKIVEAFEENRNKPACDLREARSPLSLLKSTYKAALEEIPKIDDVRDSWKVFSKMDKIRADVGVMKYDNWFQIDLDMPCFDGKSRKCFNGKCYNWPWPFSGKKTCFGKKCATFPKFKICDVKQKLNVPPGFLPWIKIKVPF